MKMKLFVLFVSVLLLTACFGQDEQAQPQTQVPPETNPVATQPLTPTESTPSTQDVDSAAPQVNEKCEQQYQNLVDLAGKDYSDCYGTVELSECEKKKAQMANKKKNLVLVVDASGSMAAQVKGQSKMEIAKAAASEFITNLDPAMNLSVVVYGHKGNNTGAGKSASCAGIEEVYYLGELNADIAKSKITPLQPTGWTPIAASLAKAQEILNPYPQESNINTVVLISDGEETCGGDPKNKASELNKSNLNVVVNVVGFDVGGAAESQLKSVATNGGGQYFSARTSEELQTVLARIGALECTLKSNSAYAQSLISVNTSMSDCLLKINTELNPYKIKINMLGVGNNKEVDEKTGVSVDCKKYVMDKYSERSDSIREQINAAHEEGKEKLDSAFGDK